jgi:osmotically inducible lipoprotein OsmB
MNVRNQVGSPLPRAGMAVVLALLVAPLLAGCGNNVVDRTVSGGLIGAGSGAVVGAAVGNPAAGALIGGAAGAVTGAVTTGTGPNLGKPIWR